MLDGLIKRLRGGRNETRAADPAAAPLPSPFQIHRVEALNKLREGVASGRLGDNQELIELLLDVWSSDCAPSIILPNNGMFLQRNTPLSVNIGQCRMPFKGFVLEYSTTRDWYINAAPGSTLPNRTLLLVVAEDNQPLKIWSIWAENKIGLVIGDVQEPCIDLTDWQTAKIGLEYDLHHCLAVDEQGRPSSTGGRIWQLKQGQYSTAELQTAVLDYCHEVHVLAQFLTVFNSKNIQLRPVAAPPGMPAPCYVLGCDGPTAFTWLPNTVIQ
jgi:hypothetical protein